MRNRLISDVLFVPWTVFPSALLTAECDIVTEQAAYVTNIHECVPSFTDVVCPERSHVPSAPGAVVVWASLHDSTVLPAL